MTDRDRRWEDSQRMRSMCTKEDDNDDDLVGESKAFIEMGRDVMLWNKKKIVFIF